jgi:hypothetical protein
VPLQPIFAEAEESDTFLTRYHEPKLSRDAALINFWAELTLNLDAIEPLQLIIGGSNDKIRATRVKKRRAHVKLLSTHPFQLSFILNYMGSACDL